jgi:hypothetical protein
MKGLLKGAGVDKALGMDHVAETVGHAADAAHEFTHAGGGLRGGAAAYGGHVVADGALHAGKRLSGSVTNEDIAKANTKQTNQSYGTNVLQNLASPGKAMDQMQQAWRGMASDVQDAYNNAQKTKQMKIKRKTSRPMSEGYKSNVNQLQGLLGR